MANLNSFFIGPPWQCIQPSLLRHVHRVTYILGLKINNFFQDFVYYLVLVLLPWNPCINPSTIFVAVIEVPLTVPLTMTVSPTWIAETAIVVGAVGGCRRELYNFSVCGIDCVSNGVVLN